MSSPQFQMNRLSLSSLAITTVIVSASEVVAFGLLLPQFWGRSSVFIDTAASSIGFQLFLPTDVVI
jgi:hypothetical protein